MSNENKIILSVDKFSEKNLSKQFSKKNSTLNLDTEYVVLYDSLSNINELKQIINKYNPKIITFNLESHKDLIKNNITHEISENYLKENELDSMQDKLYKFVQWYSEPRVSSLIQYDEVNVGELFYHKFGYFLIPILKKIYEIMRITSVYNNALFFSSKSLMNILKLYTSKIQLLEDISNKSKFNKTISPIFLKNIFTTDKFKKKIIYRNEPFAFSKIVKFSYVFFKVFSQNKKFKKNQPNIVLINHTTKRFQSVLENLPNYPINLIKYDTKIPAFWDFNSLSTIIKSNVHIEHSLNMPKSLMKEEKSFFKNDQRKIFEDNFFSEFFSLNNISFWNIIKNDFIEMYNRCHFDAINEINKIKFLFKKYNLSYILIIGSESDFFNLIAIKMAKKFKIKIGLMQHAMTTDDLRNSNNFIVKFDNFTRIIPSLSDHFLVWDKLTQDHAIKQNLEAKKIIPMGCPFFDSFFQNNENHITSKNEYILLAISPFIGINSKQLSIKMQIEFENTIKKICQITTKMNKKLLIKIHHSATFFDEKIIKKINPDIMIKYSGSFYEYVKNCELLICIDMSTSILDAMLLKKPVISILVIEKDSDSELFQKNYVLQSNIENLEKTLSKITMDHQYKLSYIKQGEKFINKFIINPGTSSSFILNFLSSMNVKKIE